VRGDPKNKGLRSHEDPETHKDDTHHVLADRPDNCHWMTMCHCLTLGGWEIRSPLADSVHD